MTQTTMFEGAKDMQVLQPTALATMGPMQMIQSALQNALNSGAGIEVYDRLIERMERQRDYEDREALNAALQRIQVRVKPVVKDADSPRGKYASAKAIDKAIFDLCNEEGLFLSFDTEDSDKPDTILVVCDVSLRGRTGFTKRYKLAVPADGSGPKGGGVMNRTQAVGSAVTSGKRYLKNMIFNLRILDHDDNGMAAGGSKVMSEPIFLEHLENIRNAASAGELNRVYILALKAAKGDESAVANFETAAKENADRRKAGN
jgi:hypothetical protein